MSRVRYYLSTKFHGHPIIPSIGYPVPIFPLPVPPDLFRRGPRRPSASSALAAAASSPAILCKGVTDKRRRGEGGNLVGSSLPSLSSRLPSFSRLLSSLRPSVWFSSFLTTLNHHHGRTVGWNMLVLSQKLYQVMRGLCIKFGPNRRYPSMCICLPICFPDLIRPDHRLWPANPRENLIFDGF